jgi:hypothetical protein
MDKKEEKLAGSLGGKTKNHVIPTLFKTIHLSAIRLYIKKYPLYN